MKKIIHSEQFSRGGFNHGDLLVYGLDEIHEDIKLGEVWGLPGNRNLWEIPLIDLPKPSGLIAIGNMHGFTAVSPDMGTDWDDVAMQQEYVADDMRSACGVM